MINELQAELDEQVEYQAMVAKLAASVNSRKKAGGMVGSRAPHTMRPTTDRNVPNPIAPTFEEADQEENFSQVFY